MSISSYALATRNHLRFYLSNFYGDVAADRNRNCKVMLNEKTTADCGQEFISIYGSYHRCANAESMQGIDEEFGLTVAVSRKIALIPPDYRGELGYIDAIDNPLENLPGTVDEYDRFAEAWKSLEGRCREIVGLMYGAKRYELMNRANELLMEGVEDVEDGQGLLITEPLLWQSTDAVPQEVGPEHFTSYHRNPLKEADMVFGLLMKVHFGEARRLVPVSLYDETTIE